MADPPPLRERLAWSDDGALNDGEIRYLLIRTDSLMQVFKRLPADVRRQALDAFEVSLSENGRKSLQARMRRLNLSRDQLYDDIAKSSASQLGWGVWTFQRSGAGGFTVAVANSPFVHGFGPSDHPVCFPIKGMLVAMGELVLGSAVHVEETACAAVGGQCCHFAVSRMASGS